MERNPKASFTLSSEAVEALRSGNALEAIKIIRASTGIGLAEAKAIVEQIQATIPEGGFADAARSSARAPAQRLAPGQVAPSSGLGKWLALIAFAIIAIGAAVYFR